MKKLLLVFLFFININFAWALTPAQEVVLFSGPPQCVVNAYGKWSPLPDLVANDDTGCYWVKGRGTVTESQLFTNPRTGVETTLLPSSPSGFAYQIFSAGQTAITLGVGAQEYEARSNLLSASTSPATQTTASLATGTYTLWVNGSGSAQMSLGTGVGCGTGTATNGTPVNFTISVSGTCIVTVTGSLNAFQLELGSFGTPFIPCVTAPCARSADIRTGTAPSNSIALKAQTAFFKTTGSLSTSGGRFIESSSNIILINSVTAVQINDGTNVSTATIGGSGTASGTVKGLYKFSVAGQNIVANNGTHATAAAGIVGFSGTFIIGNRGGGDRALNGQQQQFALWLTQPTLTGITVP